MIKLLFHCPTTIQAHGICWNWKLGLPSVKRMKKTFCHSWIQGKLGSKLPSVVLLPLQEGQQGKKMAGFENDLLAVKNDHNALTAKLNSMLYLKVRYFHLVTTENISKFNTFVCVGGQLWPSRASCTNNAVCNICLWFAVADKGWSKVAGRCDPAPSRLEVTNINFMTSRRVQRPMWYDPPRNGLRSRERHLLVEVIDG